MAVFLCSNELARSSLKFDVPALDRELGIEAYLTDVDGIGGRIRSQVEDFSVDEIPLGYSSIEEFTSSSLSRMPSRYENYAICLLEKRGIDTLQAANIIAQRLHLKEEELGYCGLKDAKAITRQLVSIPLRRPLQREYEFPEGIRLQLLGFRYRPLTIGELTGNQFSITTRKIPLENAELLERLNAITKIIHETGGFPGYFGYQRFGSRRPVSHLVGRMLHQGNLEGAVNILLTSATQTETKETREAREQLALENDYGKAAGNFPEYLGIEIRVLEHLRRYHKDFEGALKRLPMRLKRLFYDAYQSYLYNKALSLRLHERKSLTQIQPNDIVASFDARGYVKKLTKVSGRNIAKTRSEVEEKKVIPVISIPSQFQTKSNHPVSPEVAPVIEAEGLSAQEKSSIGGRDSGAGLIRPVLTRAENLGWIIGEDELDMGFRKTAFYFRLQRGFYATILLREFLKPEDPLVAGF